MGDTRSIHFNDGATVSVGDRFDTRSVIDLRLSRAGNDAYAVTRCDCGKKATVWASNLSAERRLGRPHVCRPSRPRPLPPDEAAKERARRAVAAAVASGLLVRPEYCSLCRRAARRIVGHHRDYAHPLAVVWCCDLCHAADHARMRQGAPAQQPA